eukprot:NODE_444_length_7340_cov_0.313631.p3 type:complete len:321 gc:universal NODE_444_length_7340_cov_0.313631:4209-3247(-)
MLKSAIQKIANNIKDPHFKNVIHSNILDGKLMRGNLAFSIATQNKQQAAILGACSEYLQSSYLILDDIMDGAEYRRGKPAWHKQVGTSAINDGIFLRELIHQVLLEEFQGHPNYTNIINLFNHCHLYTMFGQHLDMQSHPCHFSICKFKTSYYSFYLPIMLGLYVDNTDIDRSMPKPMSSLPWHYNAKNIDLYKNPLIRTSNSLQGHVHELSIDLGYYFQSQDDLLDILPKSVTGKDQYQDVESGKQTWLKMELKRTTGRETFTPMEQIDYYKKLDFQSKFEVYEKWMQERIAKRLDALQDTILVKEIPNLLKKLHCRKQ